MVRHILVPLDGSSFGEAALRLAFAVAQRAAATRVTLLSVLDPWSPTATAMHYAERESYLHRLAPGRSPSDAVRCVVRCGHPADQILEEAAAIGADLIVMSTHGRGGVSRLWLGSVADQCLRNTSIPLLLIRPQPSEQQGAGAAFLPNRVIVPLDGTPGAEAALRRATSIARAFAVPVGLIRVAERVAGRSGQRNGTAEDVTEAREYLDRVAAGLRTQGTSVTVEVVAGPHAAEAILGAAAGEPIVMSTHARAPLTRALLGSVADKVVRGARGVVLLIPPRASGPVESLQEHAEERLPA